MLRSTFVLSLLAFASHACGNSQSQEPSEQRDAATGLGARSHMHQASTLRTFAALCRAFSPTAFNLYSPGALSSKAGDNDIRGALFMQHAENRYQKLMPSKKLDAQWLNIDFNTNYTWRCDRELRSSITRRTLLAGAALTAAVPGVRAETTENSLAAEVVYPSTLLGPWVCQRMVLSVEGNTVEAERVWSLLGGDGEFRKGESYMLQYIAQPAGIQRFRTMLLSSGVVLDRGLELKARVKAARVNWDVQTPDSLSYKRSSSGDAVEFKVVQRIVEAFADKDWGSNELIRITAAGSAGNSFARVQRRFRFVDQESRDPRTLVVEGMEVVETYSDMVEALGNKKPTSTTQSMIRLTRPEKKGR